MANFKDLIVTGDARIVGKLYANQSMPDGIFFLSNVSGTAAVTSSPYTSSKWYTTVNDNRITSLYSGLTIAFKIPVAGNGTYGTVLNVNGLGDHPVVYNVNSMISTRYGVGGTITLTYNATQTATGYANSSSATTYTGCWQMEDYDTTNVYQLRDNNATLKVPTGTSLYRYQLCFTDSWGQIIPYNNVNNATTNYAKALNSYGFDPWAPIYYYSSTTAVSAGSNAGASALYQHVNFDCRYSMNIQSDGTAGTTALTAGLPVYIKAQYQNGWASLYANVSSSNYLERSSIVQELPNEDPSIEIQTGETSEVIEFIFIYLGRASSKYQIELDVHHPIYKWNDFYDGIWLFTPSAGIAEWAAGATSANSANSAGTAIYDKNYNDITETYATKSELNTAIGNIDSALNAINGEVI